MDTPKISVLIPSYNRKDIVEMCVNSALNQTFRDFEIIIRDDCSTALRRTNFNRQNKIVPQRN